MWKDRYIHKRTSKSQKDETFTSLVEEKTDWNTLYTLTDPSIKIKTIKSRNFQFVHLQNYTHRPSHTQTQTQINKYPHLHTTNTKSYPTKNEMKWTKN